MKDEINQEKEKKEKKKKRPELLQSSKLSTIEESNLLNMDLR